jgi:HlyD family secretion protein
LVALVLLVASSTLYGGWHFLTRRQGARPDLLLHKIEKKHLPITITDRGSLEPAENTYISCKVKAKTPGGSATSIRWVIDNGSLVKEGDRIMELDDSALRDQLADRQIEVFNAKKAWKQAELQLTIDLLTNDAAVETKKTELEVAKISLQEYRDGVYEQNRLDLKNKATMADSDLAMWEERAIWSERMSRPGRQYVTVSQAEADEARRLSAALTRRNILKQVEVLDNLTKKKNEVDFQGKIDEAARQVKLAQEKLEKTRDLDEVALDTAKAVLDKQEGRLYDLEKEIDSCFIRAPRDGMVVYYVEERARFGNTTAGVIAQGEQVKEGQKLLSVPDLSHLVVNARVHEAMVSRVTDDKETITGFSEAINTALLFTPDLLSGLSAYTAFSDRDVRSAFSAAHSQLEKRLDRRGLDATVRVNAFPDIELKGHVKSVAPVASQTDFFSSDVKVYQTYIAIDDTRLEGLKPGMDAVVKIFVDSTPEPVLNIPLQALLGGVEMGAKRRCFVMVEGHPVLRDIELGKANETVAEVKEGLQEGDEVVLNPAVLLSDKEKAEYGVSSMSSQGGRGGPGGAGDGRGRGQGGKGKKGPGGPPGMQGGPGAPGGRPPSGPISQGGAPTNGKARANP